MVTNKLFLQHKTKSENTTRLIWLFLMVWVNVLGIGLLLHILLAYRALSPLGYHRALVVSFFNCVPSRLSAAPPPAFPPSRE
ncbi:hypothetical protein Ancab_033298 [Ancistrocladus abbreviatus]